MKRMTAGWMLLLGTVARAATLTVPDPFPTIQAAINAAAAYDTVAVSPGTYPEHINYIGKQIVVRGLAGRDSTVIQAHLFQKAVVSFVTGESAGAVFEGFTVRYARDAPGIDCLNSSPIIQYCDISWNEEEGRGGHGVLSRGAAMPTIRFNRIHNNAAQYGGAVYATGSSGAAIHFNEIFGNWARLGSAVYVRGGLLAMTHNLVHGNQKATGVVYADGTPTSIIRNNAFVGNGGGLLLQATSGDLRNNIFADNRGVAVDVATATVGYNCYLVPDTNGTPGPGDLLGDPQFTDPGSGDFSLQPTSPCIDAGDPNPAYNDSDGTRGDIGPGPVQGFPHTPWWPNCPIVLSGDLNGSGTITSADLISCVNYCFRSGPTPLPCAANGDVTCNGSVTAADIIHIKSYIFGAAASDMAFKGGGDPPCVNCRMIYYGEWTCP